MKEALAQAKAVRADLARVTFDTDSAKANNPELLAALAKRIAGNRDLQVTLVGLADGTGNSNRNRVLAAQRAQFVRAFLLEHGVLPEQIADAKGEGDFRARALAENGKAADDPTFRRVDVSVTSTVSNAGATADVARAVTSTGLSTGALLNGLTDYLISEAVRAVEDAAMRSTVERLCKSAETAAFIRASCAAFDTTISNTYFPSVTRLRAAIRQDLSALPVQLGAIGLRAKGGTIPQCALVISAEYFVSLSRGESPQDALVAAGTDATGRFALDIGTRLGVAAGYLARLDSATTELIELRPAEGLDRDCVVTYVVKALAVNTPREQRLRAVDGAARLIASVDAARAAWQDVAREIRSARSDSTKASRGALLAALIGSGTPAISEVLAFVDTSRADTVRAVAGQIREATTSLATGRYGEALGQIMSAASMAGVPVNGRLMAPLAFAADVAQASTPDEVSSAFRRYNNPGRGVARKRDGGGYISVNGYAGMLGGAERSAGRWAGAASLALPVGIEAGSRVGRAGDPRRPVSSIGVLAQLIDLGSLAAVRIRGGDSVEQGPPSTFASVWAPGLLLRLGLGTSRFVAGSGVSYVPIARREKGNSELRSATRITLSISADVPLYPFAQ